MIFNRRGDKFHVEKGNVPKFVESSGAQLWQGNRYGHEDSHRLLFNGAASCVGPFRRDNR